MTSIEGPESAKPRTRQDLELIPTDDLVAAILDRCDCGVIAYIRIESEPDKKSLVAKRWKGPLHTVAGLAMDAVTQVLEQIHKHETPADGLGR